MSDTYKCAECGETFEKGWSDEEAIGEAEAVLGTYDEENMAVVCDDCYQKIMREHPIPSPEERERLERKADAIRVLLYRPGTPGEAQAAQEALDRIEARLRGEPPREPLPDGFELLVGRWKEP